jgi:hypothetical protein
MKTISIAFVAMFSLAAFAGCKKKGGGDINSTCEDVFAHAEKDGGKWSPGKGDKKAFMDYCLTQKPEVVHCSSMEIDFNDKDCEKLTGVMADDHTGFEAKHKLGDLRDGRAGAPTMGGGSGSALAAGGGSAAAGSDTAAAGSGSAAAPAAGGGDMASTGMKNCDDLVGLYAKMLSCDKMPAAGKDAQKQALDGMKTGWAAMKDMPQASKDTTDAGCKTSADAMHTSMKAMGCE